MTVKNQPTREALKTALQRLVCVFDHRKNVTGFDIGYKWQGGSRQDQVCLRLHVDRKIHERDLCSGAIFPQEFDGISLDILQSSYHSSRPKPAQAPTPTPHNTAVLMGGLACGRETGNMGQIGALVVDKETGTPALLSSWQALSGLNGRPGDPIFLPGKTISIPGDRIGTLSQSILGRDGDAAIATLGKSKPWLPTTLQAQAMLHGARNAALGEILSGPDGSPGSIVDGQGIYRLQYQNRPGQVETHTLCGFRLVAIPTIFSRRSKNETVSKSGALWFQPLDQTAVGLQAGGGDMSDRVSIACNLMPILKALNVRLANLGDIENRNLDQANSDTSLDCASHSMQVRAVDDPLALADPRYGPGDTLGATLDFGSEVSVKALIWPQIKRGLGELPISVETTGAKLTDPIAKFLPLQNMQFLLAEIVNQTTNLRGRMSRNARFGDFADTTTFRAVCRRIGRLMNQN